MENNPLVFISYSHDSEEHQNRVLQLSNKLRSEGIDCILDQYEDSPPEGWPKWMDKNVKKSDFVLVVCTEAYYNRTMGNEENGLGIKWESTLIYQQLYNAGSNNTKFIPIHFDDAKFEHIPEPLQGATFYNIDDPQNYEKLYWRLCGIKTKKPELGKLRSLPKKERKTLFISGLINQTKWTQAKWMAGVSYLYSEIYPPVFTVLFKNLDLGVEIFKEIIEQIGNEDLDERLRISIIEGNAPNQDDGYFVVIGENFESTKNLVAERKDSEEIRYIAINQRIHRMKPNLDSENLSNFKKEFAKYACYYVAPAQKIEDPIKGIGFKIEMDYKILKRKIEFRAYDEIPENDDPDSILKSKNFLEYKF